MKIEKLDPKTMPYDTIEAVGNWIGVLDLNAQVKIMDKINELVEAVNKMEKGKP